MWAEIDGRPLSLSDLDLYAVVPDRRAQRAARRRLKLALAGGPAGPPPGERLRFAARGTPQHRLGASAAVMLIRAVADAMDPGAAAGWRAALARLGVVRAPGEAAAVERELLRCWDRWVLGGQRGVEAP